MGYNGYINPYYWVDDHPLLYGKNVSLDLSTHNLLPTRKDMAKTLKQEDDGIWAEFPVWTAFWNDVDVQTQTISWFHS